MGVLKLGSHASHVVLKEAFANNTLELRSNAGNNTKMSKF